MNGKKYALDNPAFESSNDDAETRNGKNADKDSNDGDGDEERAQWGNGLEFLMSCIAMSVGLGNIWRFPFTAYENGGGAFLIPYIIILILIGRPLYYMEMGLGQFSSRGNIKAYEALSPALKGIGYAQLLGSICVATYYCSLMAISLFYLANSFTSDLPWARCYEDWEPELLRRNVTCIPTVGNITTPDSPRGNASSSELWFTIEVLKEKQQIDDGVGYPEWRLSLCLLASWAITCGVSLRGVKSSGKASYFLALFPYVIMIALLIRAVTLEGAGTGILYFIRPQWDKLLTADVWYAAVTQCFFSLNVGFGTIIMYSSYNNFHHNINRDALVVTTLDTCTSLLAGTTIFGILGNLAHELGVDVDEVINSGGTGLAFISYPEAIAKFDAVPWLFAILFFFMLFVLGVGSLVALHGCANTAIMDAFPSWKPWTVAVGTAIIGFLVGLVYVTPGGQFILNMVDFFGGTFIIFVFAILEIMLIVWWYGLRNFCNDIEYMVNIKVGIYWRMTWGLLMPVILIIIFVYFVATISPLTYGGVTYPVSALACGWAILGAAVLQFFWWIFYDLWQNRKLDRREMFEKSFGHENWGPTKASRREEWRKFKEEKERERPFGQPRLRRVWSDLIGR